MKDQSMIPANTLCLHYNIEVSFVTALHQMGLIELEIIEQDPFIRSDQLSDLERMIRLHHELHLNLEGIDVVVNLLQRERKLRLELQALENRLRLYENH